ncbi:MAG: hypothetical protein HKN73_11450 [Gemmatimonadetes bacterium]|nr:hypothetical protein [Gemmatimonadota bacterium]
MSPALAEVVHRALAKDPADRDSDAAEFMVALDAAMERSTATTSATAGGQPSGDSKT